MEKKAYEAYYYEPKSVGAMQSDGKEKLRQKKQKKEFGLKVILKEASS